MDRQPYIIDSAEAYNPKLKWFFPLLTRNSFIAGGCFKNFFTNTDMRDIDIWFTTQDAWEQRVEKLKASIDYKATYNTKNGAGFRHSATGQIIELINTRFGTPEEILNGFDFNVVKFALYRVNDDIMTMRHHYFEFDLQSKRLDVDILPKTMSPDGLYNRIHKYTTYEFTPSMPLKKMLFNAIRQTPEYSAISDVNGKFDY